VMDDGRLAEYGSPQELLSQRSGAFTSMVSETGESAAKVLHTAAQGRHT
jgi:ABC-type multidrug transport system fused ATPase/permease subunit